MWAANTKCTEVAKLLLAVPGIKVNLQADVSHTQSKLLSTYMLVYIPLPPYFYK